MRYLIATVLLFAATTANADVFTAISFGCRSRAEFAELMNAAGRNDTQAFAEKLLGPECTTFRVGLRYTVLDENEGSIGKRIRIHVDDIYMDFWALVINEEGEVL